MGAAGMGRGIGTGMGMRAGAGTGMGTAIGAGVGSAMVAFQQPSSRGQSSSFEVIGNGPFIFSASNMYAKRVSFIVALNIE